MVRWRPHKIISKYGPFETDGRELDVYPNLLADILAMPKQNPISFEMARCLYYKAHNEACKANDAARMNWLFKNWLSWLSEQGLHIELTGSEYEIVEDREPPVIPRETAIKLTVQVEDISVQLVTSSQRPPIEEASWAGQNLQILYCTGQVELAKPLQENVYVLRNLSYEILLGMKSEIEKFEVS